jgi:hypothetical protein
LSNDNFSPFTETGEGMRFSKSFNLIIIGELFALVAITGAMAAEAIIGGVSINLPPAGFCELATNNPSDSNLLIKIGGPVAQSGNKLLSMSAECQQLADWRARKRPVLDDYGQYQTPIGQMDQLVAAPDAAVRQTCAELRKNGDQIVSDQTPDIKAHVEETLKPVKMNEQRFIGVLAEDQTACYAGLIQKIQTEAGADKTQIVLIAITVVKSKQIFAYRMAVYTGSDAVTALLAKFKGTVAARYAAN